MGEQHMAEELPVVSQRLRSVLKRLSMTALGVVSPHRRSRTVCMRSQRSAMSALAFVGLPSFSSRYSPRLMRESGLMGRPMSS